MLLQRNIYAFATLSFSICYKTTFSPLPYNGKIEQFSLTQSAFSTNSDRTKKRLDRNSRLDQVGNFI